MAGVMDDLGSWLRQIERRLETQEAREEGEWRVAVGAGTSAPPTSAELSALFGSPADLPVGFRAVVQAAAAGRWYIVSALDGAWYYAALTAAP